jgi:hypothetical protein
MYIFGYAIILVMQMMFSVDVLNTKVIDNSIILLVLEFHDHRPDNLGVMKLPNALSCIACSLCRSE